MRDWFGVWLTLVSGLVAFSCAGLAMPTPTPTPGPDLPSALRQAIQKLTKTRSYRLTVTGTNRSLIEGKEWVWPFSGEGWGQGDRFYSRLAGPADSFAEIYVTGGQVNCRDARGEVRPPQCGFAFGGIGVGAAPYTAIVYLRNFEEASLSVVATSEEQLRLAFQPNLAQVAALDESHRQVIQQVTAVAGEVTLDRGRGLPLQETVWVDFRAGDGVVQRTTITLEFYGLDQPLEPGEPVP